MARRGSRIFNPVTRTHVVFEAAPSENEGRAIVVDWFVPPGEMLPGRPHVHIGPAGQVAESFDILAGTAEVVVNGRTIELSAPATLDIHFNQNHVHPANVGKVELHVRQRAEPEPPQPDVLLRLEQFFETLMALSQRGKVRRNGDMKDPLQLALSMQEFLLDPTFVAGVPQGLQKAMIGGMARLARKLGYRAYHEPDWS